jgi:D-alanine transaminase
VTAPVVYLDGAFVPKGDARLSPDDRGFLFGDGVYEVARAVDGRFFALDAHLARLARGAAALALPLPAGGVGAVAAAWEALLDHNGLRAGEAVVYCQITRGAAARAHQFPSAGTPATVYAYAQRLAPPDALRATGVACVTYPDLRWERCDLKTVNLLPNVLARQAAAAAGAFEAVLVRAAGEPDADAPLVGPDVPPPADDGVVTEGSLSSVFAVVGGELRTHPAGARILPGVTRAVLLEIAKELGVPVRESGVHARRAARGHRGVRRQHHRRRAAGGRARRPPGRRRAPGRGDAGARRRAGGADRAPRLRPLTAARAVVGRYLPLARRRRGRGHGCRGGRASSGVLRLDLAQQAGPGVGVEPVPPPPAQRASSAQSRLRLTRPSRANSTRRNARAGPSARRVRTSATPAPTSIAAEAGPRLGSRARSAPAAGWGCGIGCGPCRRPRSSPPSSARCGACRPSRSSPPCSGR